MKRFSQFAIIILAVGAMAAAQAPAPPAPPAPTTTPKAPRIPAVPATPATPAVPPVPPASSKHYSYLGVTVRDISADRVSALKLKDDHGVEIVLVDSDSPAGKAGLREHDVVLTFNGRTLQSPEEFRKLIRDTTPGQMVELGISRDGQRLTVKPQLADRQKIVYAAPKEKIKVSIPRFEMPIITTLSSRNGVVVENLTPQLGEVFGVKDGAGVLVRSVEKGSAGETAGLRAGDVIVRVGNEQVANTSAWNHAMRDQKPGPVQLGIMRDKRQQNLSFTVPERSRDQMIVIPGKAFARNMEDFGDDMGDFSIDMHDFQNLQPEIDRAMRDQQEKVRRELERAQREIERALREQERARDRAEREADLARERAQSKAERERERAQEQAEQQREKAQQQAEREREKALEQAERAREQADRDRERAEEQAERAREKAEHDREQQQQQNQNPPKPPLQ